LHSQKHTLFHYSRLSL